MTKKNFNGILKLVALVAFGMLFIFVMNGCVSAYHSSARSPNGHSRQQRICVAGNCGTEIEQVQVATVDTRGYEACVASFTADNEAGLAICEEGVANCRYSQVQIMDACTLRAGALNGTQFGMMPFGQFMPLYAGGYFGNPGMIAGYDMQRQQALYGPQAPVLPPASQMPASMTDAQLEAAARRIDDESVRRAELRAAARAAQ